MKSRRYLVYRIVCFATGMSYVGATVQSAKARWRAHLWRAATYARDTPLYEDIRKFGEAAFKIFVLHETTDFETAMTLERAEIAQVNTLWPHGYNLQSGGRVGALMHEKSKNKLSECRKGSLNPFYGQKHSEDTKQKIKETRKNSSKWKQALCSLHEGNKGKSWGQHTDDAKARMSAAKKGIAQSREHVEKRMAGMRAARTAREALKKAALVGE